MPRNVVLLCSALALFLGACVPSEEEADEFGENSPMAAIQEAGELVVAVPADAAPFSSGGESPQGFVVDLARDLAEALEVDIRYIEAESEEMIDLVAGPDPREIGDEQAHVAFPLDTVTYELYRDVSRTEGFDMTTPFFIGHQRLLVRTGSDIESAEDLAGKTVCTLVDEEAGLPLETVAPEAEEHAGSGRLAECADALLPEGDADAVMAGEVDLLRVLALIDRRSEDSKSEVVNASSFDIVGDDLTTQGYAPYVVKGMTAFSSDVFSETQDDGGWTQAYETWISPLNPPSGEDPIEPPELTLQEAAAIYPIED